MDDIPKRPHNTGGIGPISCSGPGEKVVFTSSEEEGTG